MARSVTGRIILADSPQVPSGRAAPFSDGRETARGPDTIAVQIRMILIVYYIGDRNQS